MGLNCRPGDLAIVVASRRPENIGKVVEVLRPAVHGEWLEGLRLQFTQADGHVWVVRGSEMVACRPGGESHPRRVSILSARDSCLRPLRDDPGTDEIIRIAGLPATTEKSSAVGA